MIECEKTYLCSLSAVVVRGRFASCAHGPCLLRAGAALLPDSGQEAGLAQETMNHNELCNE